jgi:hypothetical protein
MKKGAQFGGVADGHGDYIAGSIINHILPQWRDRPDLLEIALARPNVSPDYVLEATLRNQPQDPRVLERVFEYGEGSSRLRGGRQKAISSSWGRIEACAGSRAVACAASRALVRIAAGDLREIG